MAKKPQKNRVYLAMKDILARYPDGIRAKELILKIKRKIRKDCPKALEHSIGAQMSDWVKEKDDITKERVQGVPGMFYSLAEIPPTPSDKTSDDETSQSNKWKEKDFYASFAKYLTYGNDNDGDEGPYLEECTKAIALGGKIFGKKWGTPDVIGVFRPWNNASVQFPHEIISVEIKATRNNLIQALGQACAYRLFSHKVYLVIPESDGIPDRIEALCRIHGIGLVYFNPNVAKITLSIYKIKFYAQRHTPNMNSVYSVIKKDVIDKLYGRKQSGKKQSGKKQSGKKQSDKKKSGKKKSGKKKSGSGR